MTLASVAQINSIWISGLQLMTSIDREELSLIDQSRTVLSAYEFETMRQRLEAAIAQREHQIVQLERGSRAAIPTTAPFPGLAGRLPEVVSFDESGIRLSNLGGGDEAQMRRLLHKIAQEPGYSQDLHLIRKIDFGDYPMHPDGSYPAGFCSWNGFITVATRWHDAEVEDTIKHEIGHMKHGSSEAAAEGYANQWF